MANPFFTFKQFTIRHDRCAMKVGTDGVLLGAWTDVSHSYRLLDIGTGTGLIALMLAQRCPKASITAIDIDAEAVEQARENVLLSPWSDRVEVALQDICKYLTDKHFDTIVSNPPYFIDSLKCPNGQRNTARHTDTLDAERLLESVARLLTDDGRFSIILPAEQTDLLIQTAYAQGLYPSRQTAVITRPGLSPKRILMEFQKTKEAFQPDELIIELERHVYSEGYIALTKDFYLRM
jgi:tRNA1Val (adenine37-N6)-methyltransferase